MWAMASGDYHEDNRRLEEDWSEEAENDGDQEGNFDGDEDWDALADDCGDEDEDEDKLEVWTLYRLACPHSRVDGPRASPCVLPRTAFSGAGCYTTTYPLLKKWSVRQYDRIRRV